MQRFADRSFADAVSIGNLLFDDEIVGCVLFMRINQSDVRLALSRAQAGGADFAEFFFEDKEQLSIDYTDDVIKNAGSRHIRGVGLYLLDGLRSVYVYASGTDANTLMSLAERGSDLLQAEKQTVCPPLFARDFVLRNLTP